MSTKRSPGLVCGVTAFLLLVAALPGHATESPPTILWNVTSVVENLDVSDVGFGPDGHPVVAGTVCDSFPTACDFRVVKHDATTGAVIWSITFDGAGFDEAVGLAIGSDGHPVIAGTSCVYAFSLCDVRTVKLDGATGAVLWNATFDSGGHDEGVAIAVGPDGNPVVIGASCPPDFTECNALTIKLNGATGAVLWSAIIVESFGTGIAIGQDGHPVGSIFPARTVKYDGASGAVLWDVAFSGSNGIFFGGGVAIGPDGNPVVSGTTGSDCVSGFCDFLTVKYDGATGAELWSVAFDAGEFDQGSKVAIGGDGHPVVTGISCAVDLTACGLRTVKYDGATGALLWTVLFDAGSGAGVAIGPDGNPVVTYRLCTPDSCDLATIKYLLQHDTPTGAPVALAINGGTSAADGVGVTFTSIGTAGSTTMTASASGPTPPAGFSLGNPPRYYDLATTAAFSGSVKVCINYSGIGFTSEPDLKLFHFEGGVWVDHTISLDTTNKIICASVTSFSPFAILEPTPINVTIDIKPGSFPNSINLGSGGTVPVAIFSTTTFDATNVNPTTVTLASAPAKLTGKGKPMASVQDVNGDGLPDLLVHVETQALQLSETDTVAVLRGKTFDGKTIRGTDSVRVVP